jgi:caffeoyl-CoA O-methyltransferase
VPTAAVKTGMKEVAWLKMMVHKIGAQQVLEIGTYDGTSALAMAEALPEDGTVITCEINPGLVALARKRLSRHPHGRKVEVQLGPAIETLTHLTGPFDLIFVDADTSNYVRYYRQAMSLLSTNGVLLMDNMQGSALTLAGPVDDPSIAAIQELSRILANDPRMDSVLTSARDGVMVITQRQAV